MSRGEDSAPVDPAILARLLAVAESIRAGDSGPLADRLAWESACLQLLDRVWPRPETAEGHDPIPESVGRYAVIRELGRGGFGVVYLARDPNLRRDVALKVPLPGMIGSTEVRRRFLREAQAVSGLDHPNIVPIHDAETVGPVAYIVSAYCAGPSLAAWLKSRTEPVAPRVAAALVQRLTQGVQHAHDRNIWHRDLKPANIMLQPNGDAEAGGLTPRITDFGLAKITDGSAIDETRSGLIIGSAPYMAPEQVAARSGEVGPATDVYALGATLYEILVGRPPFVGRSQGETLHLALTADPIPPLLLRREIPRDLQTICLHALRKHPGHRYPTAAALGADLARFLADQPVLVRPASWAERGWKWARRHPLSAGSVAAGVALIALIGLGMAWSNARLRTLNDQLRHAVARADHQAAEANRQRRLVADREAITDRHLHAARLTLAQQAINAEQPERAQAILADTSEAAGPDRRDFAWHYLWNQARREIAIWGHHTALIRHVAISPDGTVLASGDESGLIQFWNGATQQRIGELADRSSSAERLCFSPDGRILAVAGFPMAGSRSAMRITLWNRPHDQPRVLTRIELPGISDLKRLMFAAEGEALLALVTTVGEAQNLLSWDLAGLNQPRGVASIRFTVPHCPAAAVAPDGHALWLVEPDGQVNQRDPRTGGVMATLGEAARGLAALALSPDGHWLAGSSAPTRVLLWDLRAAQPPRVLTSVNHRPDELVFSADSASLVVSTGGREVRLVSLHDGTGHTLAPLNPERRGRFRFAFAPDGRWLAMNGDVQPGGTQPITFWDARTGHLERTFFGRRGFGHLIFAPRRQAVIVGNDYDLALWHPPDSESVLELDDHHDEVWAVAISPNGRTLASGGDDNKIRFWDPTTGVRLRVIAGHDATVAALAWHPDGRTVASCSLDGSANVRLWDAQTGRLMATLEGHTDKVRSILYSPDGTTLATAGTDRLVRLWDGTSGRPVAAFAGHQDSVRGLAFAPVAHHLASAGNDGSVRIWDWATHQSRAEFAGRYPATAIAYAPDGLTLASADQMGFIHLRDSATGQVRRILHSDDREIRALAYAPDGQTLVAAGISPTIRCWDPLTGQLLMELKDGNSQQINSLAFSPDGSLLIAADHGGRVLVFRGPRP